MKMQWQTQIVIWIYAEMKVLGYKSKNMKLDLDLLYIKMLWIHNNCTMSLIRFHEKYQMTKISVKIQPPLAN